MTATCLTTGSVSATPERLGELRDAFEDALGCELHVVDVERGAIVHANPNLPRCDEGWQLELMAAAARQGQPQVVADEDVAVLFALPLTQACNLPWVAYAPFATRRIGKESLAGPARLLGCAPDAARAWINRQQPWPVHALERVGRELLKRLRDDRRMKQLEREVEKVSSNLATSYEEISLLHAISQNFRLSSSDEELGTLALEWLLDCIPTEGVALIYLPVAKPEEVTYPARTELELYARGECPQQSPAQMLAMVQALTAGTPGRPSVINHNRSDLASLLPHDVRQLIVTPLVEGERVFGYLLAFNHTQGEEFGTVEANLLASVSSMLGVHCSNRDLYRQQDEFLASVVRALTSAIDAKDPYTCGHSERVARVATRIAKQLGANHEVLGTIYMAGLLHDIGKIGIDDAVLRKPGRLTEAEFEHIKQHPSLGYKILADIKQLSTVLPAVLHHHEQWDGHGYPSQLAGEQIPQIARIVAVADAYDAMSSDRPYRPGMPQEKVMSIFREGAGKQWDSEILAAFFADYQDISKIVNEHPPVALDVETWLV